MQFLKQSTAVTIHVGPAVDATDGFTPETALAAGTVDDIGLYKEAATALTDISATTTFTHRSEGMYTATLSTTDTNTLGKLVFSLVDTSICRPIRHEFMVLPANIYDSLVGGSDYLDANVYQLAGSAAYATLLGQLAQAGVYGTCITGTLTTTTMTTDLPEATDDHYNGRRMYFIGGVLDGQKGDISDYTGATKFITLSPALTEAPANGQAFIIGG